MIDFHTGKINGITFALKTQDGTLAKTHSFATHRDTDTQADQTWPYAVRTAPRVRLALVCKQTDTVRVQQVLRTVSSTCCTQYSVRVR